MMYGLLLFLVVVSSIASLVCFILVLIKMFQANQTALAIVCIVLTFCTGIGSLIAFIYGWIKASEWNIKNIMLIWTAIFVLNIIVGIGFYAQLGSDVAKMGQQMQQELEKSQKSR
jgi:hypothetical protein